MRTLLTLLFVITIPSFANAALEISGSPAEVRTVIHPVPRTVNITEQTEETAYSDQAVINLVVTTEEKYMAQSIAKNTEQRVIITGQLNKGGISNENIKSSKFSTSPEYGWFGKKPSSYKVINRIAVTITSESQLEYVASIADSNDTVELAGATFKHSQKEVFTDRVKKAALDKVMKRKAFYEENLNVKLTPVNIRDASINNTATEGAMMLEEITVTAARRNNDATSYTKAAASKTASSFDEITYRATLQVDFIIEPNN